MRVRVRDWVRYRFVDQAVGRPGWLTSLLALACLLLVALATALALLLTPQDEAGRGVAAAAWHTLTLALDPGTIGGEQGGPVFLLLMLVVTVGGILIISSLIGVLSAALNTKIEELRRGRTRVVTTGRTIVLGWSEEIHTILSELALAGDREVVILARELSKTEMEEAVRIRHGDRIRIVCRFGDPTKLDDLELLPLDAASALIVARPVGEEPDISVLMTLLALNHRRWRATRPPLAAVISAQANVSAAQLALKGWPEDRVGIVEADDIAARLLVQSRRYPGLSVAASELLSFAGVEIRIPDRENRAASFRVPMTYQEGLLSYETACLIGIRRQDGTLDINPPGSTSIGPADTPIVIARSSGARDISLLPPRRRPAPDRSVAVTGDLVREPRRENTLILGHNGRIDRIVTVLDGYVAPGSRLDIVGDEYDPHETFPTRNLTVAVHPLDPTEPGVLVPADEGGPVEFDPATHYHSVIVLAERDAQQHVDAKSLVTLLHLREIKDRTGADFTIVCELNDDANRRLARNIQADDLVVAQKVVSAMAVQYARNPGRRELFEIVGELFDAHGADMYFEPVADYVQVGVPVSFATVVHAAALRRETAIGYRVFDDRLSDDRNFGVQLNPGKSTTRTYQTHDEIIVIANRHQKAHAQPAIVDAIPGAGGVSDGASGAGEVPVATNG